MSAVVSRARPAPSRADLLVALADKAFVLIVFAAVGLTFLVSEFTLTAFGVNYAEGGGSPVEKIHPASWLALVAFAFLGARRGNPLRLIDVVLAYRGLTVFLMAWALLLVWVILRKSPFAPLVDTFLAAMIIFLLLKELPASKLLQLSMFVHAIMIANACLGLFEYLTGWRLTPFALGSQIVEGDWRSTAILGHPLANAVMTGSYLVALSLGGGRDLPKIAVPAVFGLEFASMVAFGGRSALFTAIIFCFAIGVWRIFDILRGKQFDPLIVACAFLGAPLLVVALNVAFASGFFDLFIERVADDSGSAQTRVIMFIFFERISPSDILLGPDPAYVTSLQQLEGTELGIESFWIAFILTHGAILACIFFAGLFAFSWQVVKSARRESIVLFGYFLLCASFSVSMSSKTMTLAMLTIFAMTFLRVDTTASGARA